MFRVLFLVLFFSFSLKLAAAEYIDSLFLKNGDIIQCDILELKQRVLTISTDYSESDFSIEWGEVKSFKTSQLFTVFTKEDGRYYGRINTDLVQDSIVSFMIIDDYRGRKKIVLKDIVYLKRIKGDLKDRLFVKLGFGFNWTKAQNIQQANLFGEGRYLSDRHILSVNYNYTKTTQDSVRDVFRTNGTFVYQYLFGDKFLLMLREDFLQNTEQQLKLRVTSSLGPGYIFFYSYHLRGFLSSGLSWNSEQFYTEAPRNNSLELFTTLDFVIFDWNDLDYKLTVNFYPSMTSFGRYRFDNVTSLSYDLPFDFFIGTSFNMNYDSRPTEDAAKLDFVFSVNFGWKWDP